MPLRTQHQSNHTRRKHCRMCLGHSEIFQMTAFCGPNRKGPAHTRSASLQLTGQSVRHQQLLSPCCFPPPCRMCSKMSHSLSWNLHLTCYCPQSQRQAQLPLYLGSRQGSGCSGQLRRGVKHQQSVFGNAMVVHHPPTQAIAKERNYLSHLYHHNHISRPSEAVHRHFAPTPASSNTAAVDTNDNSRALVVP